VKSRKGGVSINRKAHALVVALSIVFACYGIALANYGPLPQGQYTISAQNGAEEIGEPFDDGHMDVAGLVTLNSSGGANSLSLTLAYQDVDEDDDGITCFLSNPSDLTYSVLSGGIGTLVLSVSGTDSCFQGNNSSISVNETGNSITFKLYALDGVARIVSTTSDLVSTVEKETIAAPTIAGAAILLSFGRLNSLPGPSLAVATGQTTDSNYTAIGHLSYAGAIDFTQNSANQLDLTLI
jgi:hypothetical protein